MEITNEEPVVTILNFIYFHLFLRVIYHIAQNIGGTCQKYFQSFVIIEILSQYFCQILQNISLQHYNFNILKYFCKIIYI